MKQLFRYTSTRLSTATLLRWRGFAIPVLLGVLAIINIPVKAQTAGLPDAFETMDPATIIGDGNYYYIQFYDGDMRSYLTDCGVGVNAESKDFLPYANNRLWTLLPAGDGDASHFYLKNKDGHYLYFETGVGARVKCTDNRTTASILQLTSLGDGYRMSSVANGQPMYRNGNAEWSYLPCNANYYGSRVGWYRLRFVKLKSNSAFIIYYRGEGTDNSNSGAPTSRHYLTYSGTASSSLGSNWWSSDVSSQQSIIPADKPLPSLPTLAAYHKDGLWTIEEADVSGQFYIKKYGTNQYLNEHNHSGIYDCALEGKDATKGTYTLEEPLSNRYTRIQNVKYETTNLTADMFCEWDGYGASAQHSSTQPEDKSGFLHLGETLNGGALVAGTSGVEYLTYADLSSYQKMIINGTPNMQLRVLLDRQEHNSGPYVEKNVTIGSDGTAVVDLTDLEINRKYAWPTVSMTYVSGNDGTPRTGSNATGNIPNEVNDSFGEIAYGDEAICGYNKITNGKVELDTKGWGVNYITYLQVDASNIHGNILRATLKAKVSGSTDDKRITKWGVGYNNSEWKSDLTWITADRSITTLGTTVPTTTKSSTTFEDKEFDITTAFSVDDDNIVTILVYETEAGGGYFKEPVVEIQYEPTVKEKMSYAHLNAIKRGYDGLSGTINSISLAKENNNDTRYLHHADGDGWQVLQWSGEDAKYWYAGFYPVEVVDEDEYYQVKLQIGTQMVGVSSDSKAVLKPYNDFNPELWSLEQFGDYRQYRLKSWDGKYYNGDGIGNSLTTTPTDISNSHIISTFSTIEWVLKYETRIMHDVTHKVSNVKLYYSFNETSVEEQEVLSKQGLITNDITEWWNDDGTQKVNEFKITHFVKKGDVVTYGLPTVLTVNNDHRLYQRWYKYGDDTNLEELKNHFRLKVDNQEVMSYLYNNGIVTGQKLDWETILPGALTYELNKLTYYNCDGEQFTLAADVSRYSDFTYKNESSHLDGDLEEPSLTMRYIYEMHDAKEMANALMACTYNNTDDRWYEKEKKIHFPATRLKYESGKADEFKGEFLGIRHQFKDYWVFDGNGTTDDNLVSAVTDNTSGKIEVDLDAGGTGITLAGYNNQGFYCYRERSTSPYVYGDSRFVAFKYPDSGTVTATGEEHSAYLKVYFNNNGTRYQIARFQLIFDNNSATLPWTSVDGSRQVKGTDRDPNHLEAKAGKPIAKITFDYPDRIDPTSGDQQLPATFKNSSPYTIHNRNVMEGWWSRIENSSPIPLTFDNTNYGFDGDDPSWGSYALVSTMKTRNGRKKTAMPVNDAQYGYGISPDVGMKSAFFYVDASEQPGDICAIPFTGEFCAGDLLMCSGWISGSNRLGDAQSPGSVTITVKGERYEGETLVVDDIYRFCPGQCYELDNGTGIDGSTDATYVVWQQFYFEFGINRKYERQWVEVNNNCVSSMGGDFMLDNIEVYAMVPEVVPEMNTPICINCDDSEMKLLKLDIGFDKLIVASGVNTLAAEDEHQFGLVFLNKQVFLEKMQEGLQTYNSLTLTLAQVEANVNNGVYQDITTTYKQAYEYAFNAALLGSKAIWDSEDPDDTETQGAGVLNYHWYHTFSKNKTYSFNKAVNKLAPIFGYQDPSTNERFLVLNGNYPELPWELYTDYYIISYNEGITDVSMVYQDFNICSDCYKASVFQIAPSTKWKTMESTDASQDVEVCEGKIPTVVTNLAAYNLDGISVTLKGLNYDWWLGDLDNDLIATLTNFHEQKSGDIRLDIALSTLRVYYPDATSLKGVREQLVTAPNPSLTVDMIDYLQSLVDAGQLVLHQKSVSIPAKKASDADPYCYLVACPIHDGFFDQALNNGGSNDVAYFCDQPQGLRMKVGEKAPSLKTGFVAGENGFKEYHYPDSDPVLSIRLAKKAQFETVQHGSNNAALQVPDDYPALHYLWLPVRNAKVQSTGSQKVVKSDDDNIYLASTDDPTWDDNIYTSMNAVDNDGNPIGTLPVVGRIVTLKAIDTDKSSGTEKTENRLCVYFTENFDVREGYNYTLSLPFKEDGANTCDGTILINLKIVPDYEVWTGAAGNTDWNNDENWRRADGNTSTTSTTGVNNNELYVSESLPETSGLYDYTSNEENYRTAKDRLFRKGFAPLYCTHVLLKSDEWGDAPVLYDALDTQNRGNSATFDAAPFPNLRDTSTPILKYDMQARLYDIWTETYTEDPDKGRAGDLLAEMYQVNSCDEIAFQPTAELQNAYLLNYNNAWMEYELTNKRWYLLGSALQGTIAGEWYAPTGTAQQKTTYYEKVTFGDGYDRYSPAIYQRSWDKAKAVLYEVGSIYSTGDNPDDLALESGAQPGSTQQGTWSSGTWDTTAADEYLDRLGYKPLSGNKANVAIKGIWSNTYNDATVDYTKGGFSVMVMNHLKNNDTSGGKSIIRLPKEDTMYDYYKYKETGAADGGTDTELSDVRTDLERNLNRGRLKTDLLLPESSNIRKTEATAKYVSTYGTRTITRVPTITDDELETPIVADDVTLLPMMLQTHTEDVSAGISDMGYYLVENPFPCGMNMAAFFSKNSGLDTKYWLLTADEYGKQEQQLVQLAPDGIWIKQSGGTFTLANAVVAPGQGFFVKRASANDVATITFSKDMQAQTRFGVRDEGTDMTIVVGKKKKMQEVTETAEDGTSVTYMAPVVAADGTYELEDIEEKVKVYSYQQTTDNDKKYLLKARTRGDASEEDSPLGLVITAQRGDSQSSALVMQRGEASNEFLPEEDTETFLNSDLANVPTVYTLCGRLATTINAIHDFTCLPVGVESASDAPCTLTFQGVELLGDSVAFYDAVEQVLTPLASGMQLAVSGQTQNRYFIVRSLNKREAAEETHLQIFTEGLTAKVIASTAEPLISVRCYDTAGRLVHTAAPQTQEYSFTLPAGGIYVIDAQTDADRKTKKVMTK